MNLSDYTLPQLENVWQKKMKDAKVLGADYAKYKADYTSLDSLTKSLLANIMKSMDGAVSTKKDLAYGNEEYDLHIAGVNQAYRVYIDLEVKWKLAQVELDMIRTLMTNRRSELKEFAGG